MGDRSQVCIKDGESRVYLYAHWSGAQIYHDTAKALLRVPGRHDDSEYLARAIFCEMIPKGEWAEETGFGIGTSQHGDVEHAIPVLDCSAGVVTFDKAGYHSADTPEGSMPFAEFAKRALAGEFDEL